MKRENNLSNERKKFDDMVLERQIEYQKIPAWVNTIQNCLDQIFANDAGNVPKKSKRFLLSIHHYKGELLRAFNEDKVDHSDFDTNLTALSERARSLLLSVREEAPGTRFYDDVVTLVNVIQGKAKTLLETKSLIHGHQSEARQEDIQKLAAALEILKVQLSGHQHENNRFRKLISENQKRADELNEQISTFDQRLSDTLRASAEKADVILSELLVKQQEVNELAGIVSADTVARSYAKSAEVEKKFADLMRIGSVLLMLAIVLLIGYSLFGTTQPHFDWETALFRLIFSLALSVPAAYLARESARHRAQQYSYLRVSLDLQAITPYLASLPAAEQHRLKVEIASRIFGTKETPSNPADSYPLNLQELFMALLSKIEVPKSSSKSSE